MKFDKHGNGEGLDDLYVLPESETERKMLISYLHQINRSYEHCWSDVKEQPWYGKEFICIPFGETLQDEIAQLID